MIIFGENEKVISQYDYTLIKKQANKMRPISFGQSINIVLITDRLYGCRKGFEEFFKKSTNITVDIISSVEEAESLSRKRPINFVFIVGLLADTQKYALIEKIEQINKFVSVVLLEIPTPEAELTASNYKMALYDRQASLSGLIQFMQSLYDTQTERMEQEYSEGSNRDHIWLNTIHNIVSDELSETLKIALAESLERPTKVRLQII